MRHLAVVVLAFGAADLLPASAGAAVGIDGSAATGEIFVAESDPGPDNDVLKAGKDNDSLDGGADVDDCSGGGGRDTATGCEATAGHSVSRRGLSDCHAQAATL